MRSGWLVLVFLPIASGQDGAGGGVDFVRDVEPILKASCHKCHGAGGARIEGQLRLDSRAGAMKGGVSGAALVPGRSAESRLYQLLVTADADDRMPRKAPPLGKGQVDVLRRWIDAGAPWPDSAAGDPAAGTHWAYVKPARPVAARIQGPVRNEIDAFVLAQLEKEGLAPSPEAPREKLVRRLSLDLVGLPPTVEEVDAFVKDGAPDAYGRLVERLLASPHYGERWARPWLDLARYADTNGHNIDSRRVMWKYRDWVIDAYNRDLPFTQFTIEQIAGDMLPGATLEQRIASGFHRNTMFNEEGGVHGDEAHWEVLVDRVNTTAAVWLGSTLACAQCHNHKYDPFGQRDYYRLLAFFANTVYTPAGNDVAARYVEPKIELAFSAEQEARRKEILARIAQEEKTLREGDPALPTNIRKALETPAAKRTPTQRGDLLVHYRSPSADLKEARARLLGLHAALDTLGIASALVMQERPSAEPPKTHVRIRGSFVQKGEEVTAGVPASLHPWRPEWPLNRLGLARWLVDEENPLVARVVVNRLWGEIFGRPLVETPEDFGTQGQRPAQPALLDWLATEFVRLGWSQKALLRTIVTSGTYRQSSRVTPGLVERDPYNRLLARGPRFRMEAERIRDTVLAASGLLSRKIGGPSVFPLQADTSGVIAINKVDLSWKPSDGEERHRRGLYTHWRRTAPYLSFSLFDAPSRECCTVLRPRTNTPLQALSALNDPSFFDAARGLARRIVASAPSEPRARVVAGFRRCVSRTPDREEVDLLVRLFEAERGRFAKDPGAARRVAGEPADADLAAWTLVANVLLNLDETMTKE